MKLRQEYNSSKRFDLLFVEPLNIPNFILFKEQIQAVDERRNNALETTIKPYLNENSIISTVAEPSVQCEKKGKGTKAKSKKHKDIQPKLL
jgi:hypothetical protein